MIDMSKLLTTDFAPKQLKVFNAAIRSEYMLCLHGRGTGATFLLAVLSIYFRLLDEDLKIALTSPSIEQTKMVIKEASKWDKKFDIKKIEASPINSINEWIKNCDVLLVDEAQSIAPEFLDIITEAIKYRVIKKVIIFSTGFDRNDENQHMNSLYNLLRNLPSNSSIVRMSCFDMPNGFFDLENLKELENMYDEDIFSMTFKGEII